MTILSFAYSFLGTLKIQTQSESQALSWSIPHRALLASADLAQWKIGSMGEMGNTLSAIFLLLAGQDFCGKGISSARLQGGCQAGDGLFLI